MSANMVVVSYWAEREPRHLFRLIKQLFRYEAGAPFSLALVCNGGDERPIELPGRFAGLGIKALNRENRGFNIGAWDHGWRSGEGHENFLFLQDDCSGWHGAGAEDRAFGRELQASMGQAMGGTQAPGA